MPASAFITITPLPVMPSAHTFSAPVAFAEVARRLATVFGLGAIMPVEHAGFTVADVCRQVEPRPAARGNIAHPASHQPHQSRLQRPPHILAQFPIADQRQNFI